MGEPIISVSGLRGIIGDSLSPIVASKYVASYSAEMEPGSMVVSRDGRATGEMLADVVMATFSACGRNVFYADVAATPTTGVLVRSTQSAGGIQISASHNPSEYNGLKLFGPDGRVIGASAGERVLKRYRSESLHWASHDQLGTNVVLENTTESHLKSILETVDVQAIRACQFRVLLDANHGAGSILGDRLLQELGCDVTILGTEPNGQFAHPPEPTAENLEMVRDQVVATQAQIGFCQDPDADRLALIDENGTYLGEEYTVALIVKHILKNQKGPIVTNCSTSRMTEDLAKHYDVPFFRSKVGEANVCDLMIQHHAIYGGEGNGGPIDPRVGYVRDSFVGMAQILDGLAKSQKTISQLASELPKYEIFKTKVVMSAHQVQAAFDRLVDRFSEAKSNRMDGLRLDWEDKWLLVRASNTEPIVRLVAEATTISDAQELCGQAGEVLSG